MRQLSRPKIYLISGRLYTNIVDMARPNNDQAHLRRLRDLYASMGCLPSYSRIATFLGFKAKNAAFKLTQRLIATGYLTKCPGGRLAPGTRFFTLELSEDEVRAGFGAEGNATGLVQAQTLDQLLVARPSKTVFVKLRGESMVKAGILSGDIAVVETSLQATNGDMVIAEIDGSFTVKELRVAEGRACLVQHGVDARVVHPKETFNIIGVVRGIVRSFRSAPVNKAKPIKWGVAT